MRVSGYQRPEIPARRIRTTRLGRALRLLTLAAAALIALPLSATAGAPHVEITDVRLGFSGEYKAGCWTPIHLTVQGGPKSFAGELRVITLDGDGADIVYAPSDAGVSIPAGETVYVQRYVKFGRIQAGLRVQLRDADGTVVQRNLPTGSFPQPQPATARLLVALGEAPILDRETQRRLSSGGRPFAAGHLGEAAELPRHWLGYEGVETVLVTTSDNRVLERWSEEQFAALERWVHLGGRMILSVGSQGEAIFGEAKFGEAEPGEAEFEESDRSPLSRLAGFRPGHYAGVSPLRLASTLETYSGASQRLEAGAGADGGIPATLWKDVRGRIEASHSGLQGVRPLIMRTPHGLGEVTFVAFDLDEPRLGQWEGRSRLVARVVGGAQRSVKSRGQQSQRRKVAHIGYQDLVGQLRSALDQFTDLMLVPFYWVAGLVLIYVLLIGPGDYLFLKKFSGRMFWTWVTFPLVVVVFLVLAVVLHGRLKESGVRVNQVDLVDVDTESSLVRGSMWAHVYSPRTDTYDIELGPGSFAQQLAAEPPQVTLSWQGLPGTGLGGLNTAATATSFAPPYHASLEGQMTGTPIQVSSTKALVGRWWARAKLSPTARLEANPNGLLSGQIVNPLPVELTDCLVLFDNWVYKLDATKGVLGPGESTKIDSERPLNLQWRLTRRRVVETRDVSTPWDQTTLDVARILEIMMFHEAAGGESYTRLTHGYQPFVDLSQHLQSGQAILVGRSAQPATELAMDGQHPADQFDRRWTLCRVVFPVENWRRQTPTLETLQVPQRDETGAPGRTSSAQGE